MSDPDTAWQAAGQGKEFRVSQSQRGPGRLSLRTFKKGRAQVLGQLPLAGLKRSSSPGIEKHFITPPSSEHREKIRQQSASLVEVPAELPIELMR